MVRTCTDQTFTCAHHSVEGGQCMVQALGLGMSRNEGSVRCGRRHESPSSHDLEHLHHAAATVWHQQEPVCLSVCLSVWSQQCPTATKAADPPHGVEGVMRSQQDLTALYSCLIKKNVCSAAHSRENSWLRWTQLHYTASSPNDSDGKCRT